MSTRGEVEFCPEISGHISKLSIEGRPAVAAEWSVGSTLARPQNVAYQSARWMYPSVFCPLTLAGRYPPDTKAFTHTPPCQSESLVPFSG